MGISRKIYSTFLSVKEFVSRKSFYNTLVLFFSFILFFGVMNVYAQEASPQWDGTKRFHNIISGTDGDEDNMNSRQGLEFLNTSWTVFSLLAPEATANADKVMGDASIPYDLKKGLLGMTEDVGYATYASYPKIDVPRHLAQQWVPGYDQSVSGLYASGYDELANSGIVSLWNRVLNIAYIAFVIVMIAAGFMIMFRHKLGGQAMVTVGNVLPGVIVSLILATFSFAIAGLLIDLGGVITTMVVFVIKGNENFEILSTSNIFSLMAGSFTNIVNDLGKLSPINTGIAALDKVFDLVPIVLGVVGIFSTAGAIAIPGLIIAIVLAVVVFFAALKVLIVLFKAYFSILMATIIAPIQISLAALPGNKHMIGNWFKNILRNVLVFPLVLAIINIPNAISAATGGEIVLRLPNNLTYDQNQTFLDSLDMDLGINIGGGIIMILFRIFILFFAAQAPKFLEGWLPAQESKAMEGAVGGIQASLSKIPLIGSLFKK